MKAVLICLFPLLFCVSSNAQDMASLKQRVDKVYAHLVTNESDSLVKYAHPSVFKVLSEKEFIDLHRSIEKMDEGTVSLINIPPNFKINEIKKIEQSSYCILYYDEASKIAFTEPIHSSYEKILLDVFKKRFNAEKVVFNSTTNTFLVKRRMELIAIADNHTNYEWTFFPIIEDQKIREQLGL